MEERLHIARELHGILGHHLAALSIQLEHAMHVASDPVRADIENAQASTRQMLTDVRSVVSSMHSTEQIDLAPILHSLCKRILRPKIHLEIDSRFALADGIRAHAVLRCVQEIITNTVKHSGADNAVSSLVCRVMRDSRSAPSFPRVIRVYIVEDTAAARTSSLAFPRFGYRGRRRSG